MNLTEQLIPTRPTELHQGDIGMPRWAELLTRINRHLPINQAPLSNAALVAVLNFLAEDVQRHAYCLAVVDGYANSHVADTNKHLTEVLYTKQEGDASFAETNAYPALGDYPELGLCAPQQRVNFYQALQHQHEASLQCFSEPGRQAYVVSLASLTFGVICPGDGLGANRIVVAKAFCGAFLAQCRDIDCLDVLFDQDGNVLSSVAADLFPRVHMDDAYKGLAVHLTEQFSPELISHDMPAQVLLSFEHIARRLDKEPGAWQRMNRAERLMVNRDRVIHLAMPQMFERYGLTQAAAAETDVMLVIGLADRMLAEGFEEFGSVETLLDQLDAFLVREASACPELTPACDQRLAVSGIIRDCLGFSKDTTKHTAEASFHRFLNRIAQEACRLG